MPRSCDVAVVNDNSQNLLLACVASMLAQNVARLAIVDNAAHDSSLELVNAASPRDRGLVVLHNGSNTGYRAGLQPWSWSWS